MKLTWCRALSPAALFFAALLPVQAQQPPAQPPQAPPPQAQPAPQPQAQQNPYCARLEGQLRAFDRSANDNSRADQLRKFEEAAANQQNEIDRQEAAARRSGCESNNFFALFSGQQAQCGPINNKIQQMRSNLEKIQTDIERLRTDPAPERESQRRAVLVALSQNNCGEQYRQQVAATPPPRGGLFDSLFGPKSIFTPGNGGPDVPSAAPGMSMPNGTYRTVCVRTCDGFFYPISPSATPARFAEDEKICRQSCPATEVQLYAHRNPGEDINQAVSVSTQQPYTAMPNAFRYRTSFDQSCSCKRAGENWSQALKDIQDTTVEQGDIVVDDQRARQLSQPRVDAQGKPIRPAATARPDPKAVQTMAPPPAAAPVAPAAAAEAKPENEAPSKPDPNRKVRSVGPVFIPAN